MFNKPVVAVNVTGLQDVFPYIEKGIAIGAYKKSEVSKTIKKALYDKKTKKFSWWKKKNKMLTGEQKKEKNLASFAYCIILPADKKGINDCK